jgi:hypothetical protein
MALLVFRIGGGSMNRLSTPPDGIVITLPVNFLWDLGMAASCLAKLEGVSKKGLILRGYRMLLQKMKYVIDHPDNSYWMHSMGSKPNIEFEYVYFTVLGFIKWRGNVLRWEDGHEKKFDDGRKRTAKHWLYVCNIINAPTYFPYKGTQGFRYTQKIF